MPAHYAGVAGTKQLTDRIGDEIMEMLKKWFKTVKEETGQVADLTAEGGFTLDGEAALDKNNQLGVAVRASAPNLGPNIPVDLTTEVGVDRSSRGTVQANISYYFRANMSARNAELSAIRREELTVLPDEEEVMNPNTLGR